MMTCFKIKLIALILNRPIFRGTYNLIKINSITTFKYREILEKMMFDHIFRLSSFSEVSRLMFDHVYEDFEFSKIEKTYYLEFVENLSKSIFSIGSNTKYVRDPDLILTKLQQVHKNSMLEVNIQSLSALISAFLQGSYSYRNKSIFPVDSLKKFIGFYNGYGDEKKKIVLNNIWSRFDNIPRKDEIDDDLPF